VTAELFVALERKRSRYEERRGGLNGGSILKNVNEKKRVFKVLNQRGSRSKTTGGARVLTPRKEELGKRHTHTKRLSELEERYKGKSLK